MFKGVRLTKLGSKAILRVSAPEAKMTETWAELQLVQDPKGLGKFDAAYHWTHCKVTAYVPEQHLISFSHLFSYLSASSISYCRPSLTSTI